MGSRPRPAVNLRQELNSPQAEQFEYGNRASLDSAGYSGYSGSTCTKSASTSSSTRANGSLVVVRFSSSKTYATFITQHATTCNNIQHNRAVPPLDGARDRWRRQPHGGADTNKQTHKQTRRSWRGPRRQADSHFRAQTVLASAAHGSHGAGPAGVRVRVRVSRLLAHRVPHAILQMGTLWDPVPRHSGYSMG